MNGGRIMYVDGNSKEEIKTLKFFLRSSSVLMRNWNMPASFESELKLTAWKVEAVYTMLKINVEWYMTFIPLRC
jgi:hypothetical protein